MRIMNLLWLLVIVPVALMSSCVPLIVGLGGATYGAIESLSGQDDIKVKGKREQITIGRYNILVQNGSYKKEPCIFFFVNNKDKTKEDLVLYIKNQDDKKLIDEFGQMNEPEKKRFIKEMFKNASPESIDLDFVESGRVS